MLAPLLLNNILGEASALAFIGPNIDDIAIPEDIAMTSLDFTGRFISATSYTLIGTLPDGLSFSNGVISGTPTTPGTYGPFIIRAA